MILSHDLDLTLHPMKYPQFFKLHKDSIKDTWKSNPYLLRVFVAEDELKRIITAYLTSKVKNTGKSNENPIRPRNRYFAH